VAQQRTIDRVSEHLAAVESTGTAYKRNIISWPPRATLLLCKANAERRADSPHRITSDRSIRYPVYVNCYC